MKSCYARAYWTYKILSSNPQSKYPLTDLSFRWFLVTLVFVQQLLCQTLSQWRGNGSGQAAECAAGWGGRQQETRETNGLRRVPASSQRYGEKGQGVALAQGAVGQMGTTTDLWRGSARAGVKAAGTAAVPESEGRPRHSRAQTLRREQPQSPSSTRRAGEAECREQGAASATMSQNCQVESGGKYLKFAKWGYSSHQAEASVLKFVQQMCSVSQMWRGDRGWRSLLRHETTIYWTEKARNPNVRPRERCDGGGPRMKEKTSCWRTEVALWERHS